MDSSEAFEVVLVLFSVELVRLAVVLVVTITISVCRALPSDVVCGDERDERIYRVTRLEHSTSYWRCKIDIGLGSNAVEEEFLLLEVPHDVESLVLVGDAAGL